MQLCDGFEWPVPEAFRDALRICRFSPGDILYTDSAAYSDWPSAKCKAIQVMSEAGVSEEGEDSYLLFKKNWSAGCRVKVLDLTTQENTEHSVTHGRLFTMLWRGSLDAMNGDAPSVPMSAKDSLKLLREGAQEPESGAVYELLVDWTITASRDRETAVRQAIEGLEGVTVETALVDASPLLRLLRVTYDGRAVEAFRDALKKALWPRPVGFKPTITIDGESMPRTLESFLLKSSSTSKSVPSIDDFGVFTRRPRAANYLVNISFMHGAGVPYLFRFNRQSLAKADVPKSVVGYIEGMVDDCPTHVFTEYANTSNDGCKSCAFADQLRVTRITNRSLVERAREAEEAKLLKKPHDALEKYFVENDPKTLAVELPVWMRDDELVDFREQFGFEKGMAGHIDLVRLEGDRIWIWDYKPYARKEKHAHVQVFLYAVMFALRTGVPMSRLGAGYFDEDNVFSVDW